ncbi:hypothetical protein ABG768_026031, partial [Culter alburnus]
WLIFGNAKNWLHTGVDILKDHYGEALQEARAELLEASRDRWDEAWQVAIRWARRNLKTIREATIERATAVVRRIMTREGPSSEDTALVNPRPVVAPSPPTEVRVVRLSLGPPSVQRKGAKVRVVQGEGAQDRGASPWSLEESPEGQTIRRRTPGRQVTSRPVEGQTEPQAGEASFPWSQGSEGDMFLLEEGERVEQAGSSSAALLGNPPIGPVQQPPRASAGQASSSAAKEPVGLQRVTQSLHTRHKHGGDKYKNWDLRPTRPILILGSSNFSAEYQ